ncbi:MAG: hypothetical protein ABEJ91_00185 [Candidatus Nanohaloarchaea archaeon]
MVFDQSMGTFEYLVEYFLAPFNYPSAVPELIPLILGVFILEVYFEKTNAQRLERADPIGNALLWLTTGLALVLEYNASGREMLVVYFLIIMGSGVLLVEFLEEWRERFRFFHSFITPIYSIAYLSVILVATPLEINSRSIEAALVFMGIDVVFFYFWKKTVPVPNR